MEYYSAIKIKDRYALQCERTSKTLYRIKEPDAKNHTEFHLEKIYGKDIYKIIYKISEKDRIQVGVARD